jgi:hypothetical protein
VSVTAAGSAMPTEIIESKEIYRGFIALRLATLRLADGARVSCEIIEHGKGAVALRNNARCGRHLLRDGPTRPH